MQLNDGTSTISTIAPELILERLARQRPLFHSEADFQHAYAWEMQRAEPNCEIRLEVPVRTATGAIYLDLLTRSGSSQVAVGLKYKTRALVASVGDENFALADQAAQDIGRYDFFKDLSRVEAFAQSGPARSGYAVFLTNDSAYWKAPASSDHGYAAFAMNDGRKVSGIMAWGDRASEGTRRGRENGISIRDNYSLQWKEYSSVGSKGYGRFQYLCLHARAA